MALPDPLPRFGWWCRFISTIHCLALALLIAVIGNSFGCTTRMIMSSSNVSAPILIRTSSAVISGPTVATRGTLLRALTSAPAALRVAGEAWGKVCTLIPFPANQNIRFDGAGSFHPAFFITPSKAALRPEASSAIGPIPFDITPVAPFNASRRTSISCLPSTLSASTSFFRLSPTRRSALGPSRSASNTALSADVFASPASCVTNASNWSLLLRNSAFSLRNRVIVALREEYVYKKFLRRQHDA